MSILFQDVIVRPATYDDFESVLRLITDRNRADYGEPMISEDDLHERWQSPDLILALDTWVAIAPDKSLAGYAELQRFSSSQLASSVYVASEYLDKELGAHLLQRVEERAILSRADAGRVSLTSRVSEHNQAGQQIFESAGYTLTFSFSIMEIIMTEPPKPAQWAAGITVRTFLSEQDEQATYVVDEKASQDKGYHKPLTFEAWANRMGLYKEHFDPTLWFLACSESEIAGVALNVYSQETDTGWVDHLGVRQKWRRKGIGTALLFHSLGEFYRRDISSKVER